MTRWLVMQDGQSGRRWQSQAGDCHETTSFCAHTLLSTTHLLCYASEPQQQPLQIHEVAMSALDMVGGGERRRYCNELIASAGLDHSGNWGIAGLRLRAMNPPAHWSSVLGTSKRKSVCA